MGCNCFYTAVKPTGIIQSHLVHLVFLLFQAWCVQNLCRCWIWILPGIDSIRSADLYREENQPAYRVRSSPVSIRWFIIFTVHHSFRFDSSVAGTVKFLPKMPPRSKHTFAWFWRYSLSFWIKLVCYLWFILRHLLFTSAGIKGTTGSERSSWDDETGGVLNPILTQRSVYRLHTVKWYVCQCHFFSLTGFTVTLQNG